jgi:DNA-binding MarR family transcriptional regulator
MNDGPRHDQAFPAVRPGPVAELLEHLSRRIYGACFASGLKPAQWSVLRYLQRANPSARTITAFAQFHATTKSASSQTVRLLVRKGLVTMVQDIEDSRRKRLDLTETGRAVLADDPLQGIVVTLGELESNKVFAFTEVVEALVRRAFVAELDGTRRGRPRRGQREGD